MQSILSLITTALGGAWGYIAAAALAAVLSGAGIGWTVHRIDEATIAAMKLAEAQAQLAAANAAAAIQKKEDAVSLARAVSEARAQQKITTQTVTLTKEVPVYVSAKTDARTCVTYGLVRVLDAAATGRDPAELPLGAGESDESCASVAASSLARNVAENYGAARANAEQLNALEAWVAEQAAAAKGE
jgi:hypothetical protein